MPNSLWHIDGYHKLIRWRVIIHGGIDGFSRLPVYLTKQFSESTTNCQLWKKYPLTSQEQKLDASHGYWQIPLDSDSQLLTTFNSPFGRYYYMRMPFGIKSAQEVFQKRMHQCFGDLPGVETDIDDLLVWGHTEVDHNQWLKAVLQRCKDVNLTLSRDKCQFGMSQVTYLGHVINAQGISPDSERVRAITDMPPPQDKKGVERLLGMLKYVAKFIPDMLSIIQPIRELVKKEVHFIWEWEQEAAFKKIKEKLSVAPALTFFNVKKPTTISCDASQSGLGVVLMQNNRQVAYASRALTSAENRYAQIETGLLAVVFALEKFHQYIYGTNVEIESDHTCTAVRLHIEIPTWKSHGHRRHLYLGPTYLTSQQIEWKMN